METREDAPKRMKAEYRSSIRSKTMIKEAMLELMVEKPFDKITITDIVKKADINRGTFYAHYDNTSEVLKSISASVMDEIASAFKARNNSDALWNPRGYLKQIYYFFLTNPIYFSRLVATEKISEVLNDARHNAIRKILDDLGMDLPESSKAQLSIICVDKKVNFSLPNEKENNKTSEKQDVPTTYNLNSHEMDNIPAWLKAVEDVRHLNN